MVAITAKTFILGMLLATAVVAQLPPPPPPGGGTPPGLPPLPVPLENPITLNKAVLGKILFWDEQLSSDNTVACGTCHRPHAGGADPRFDLNPGPNGLEGDGDDKFGSPGIVRQSIHGRYTADAVFGVDKQVTRRTAPSFFMGAWSPNALFWDGRATGTFINPETGAISITAGGALESQSIGPILNVGEMAKENRTWAEVTSKLAQSVPLKLASNLPADVVAALQGAPTYPALFQMAFGSATITAERIAFALATYERTLVPDQTPVDAIRAGTPPPNVLTQQQDQGRQVFFGPGRCAICHGGQVGTNNQFVNIGLRPNNEDGGRFEVTGQFADRGRFRTPSIRNTGLKTRFMHNGQFDNLADVVAFYNRGGDFGNNQDNRIINLGLSGFDVAALTAFLEVGFTDPRVAAETGPFSRPTLWSESNPNGVSQYGANWSGSGGFIPDWIALTPPSLGDHEFKVGVRHALGGVGAFLGVSPQSLPIGSSLSGTPLHVNYLNPEFLLLSYTLEGAGPGGGYTTQRFGIPNDPALVGVTLFGQWWVNDPGAVSGWASTSGAQFTIF